MQFKLIFPLLLDNPAERKKWDVYGRIPDPWAPVTSFFGTTFAYCRVKDDVAEQLHVAHTCRDYMSDYLVNYNYRIERAARDKVTNLVWPPRTVHSYNNEFTDDINLIIGKGGDLIKKVDFLNGMEKKLGVQRTEVYESNYPGYVVVLHSRWWMRTSIAYSWYLQMLRYLNDPNIKHVGDLKEISTNSTHYNYMVTLRKPWDFFQIPALLKEMGKPEKGHCNLPDGKYHHGGGGYYTMCGSSHDGNKGYAGGFVYSNDLYKLAKEEKEKCAASPAM